MSKVTQQLIDKAKAKYGEVYVLEASGEATEELTPREESLEIENATGEFKAEKGKFYALVRRPDKKVIGMALTYRDPIQMGNAILKNCIVEIDKEEVCDPEILTEDAVNIGAAIQINQLVNIGAARLKKY